MTTYLTTSRIALFLLLLSAGIQCRQNDSDELPSIEPDGSITMAFDYAGAEAILNALERDSLASADVDSLLHIHGVRAVVDNVTRYFPPNGEPEFRRAIQSFASTKKASDLDRYFQFDDVWRNRRQTRSLMDKLRKNEPDIMRRVRTELTAYRPNIDSLAITVYFVAGGVSDGFVPDNTSATNFYANLTRAKGDYDGALSNLAHEAYHLLQKAAQRRTISLVAVADSSESLPGPERLLAVTLAEGTAKYVVDRTSSNKAKRVRENFAVFDTVLAGLRAGTLTWQAAYARGFTSQEDDRFYELGFEMARAIEQYCGRDCIGKAFEVQPIEFFRKYVRLYREHPDIVGRFAPATEAFLLDTPTPNPA